MIKDNIEKVLENIGKAAEKSGRKPEDITLVAVTKTVEAERVREAYDAGIKIYGENRVQEYMGKREKLPVDVNWHIIGRLQTNKVKYIINNIKLLHSVDRFELAQEIQKQCEKHDAYMNVLLEINTGEEESKAGFDTENIFAEAEKIAGLDRLKVNGLMTVAPFTQDEKFLREVFAKTKEIYDKLGASGLNNFDFKYLSMGMSNDYEMAVEEGSNMVRVGSAIFGHRIYK